MADKVNVKTETLLRVIELIENYELLDALHILYSVCNDDYHKRIRKEKEQLYFNMRRSKTPEEYRENRLKYEEFMKKSLL